MNKQRKPQNRFVSRDHGMKPAAVSLLCLMLAAALAGCGVSPAGSEGRKEISSDPSVQAMAEEAGASEYGSAADAETADAAAAANASAEASENASSQEYEITEGIFSTFTSTDLYGNAVDESILKDSTLTMINCWGTFCGPCIREMPDLAKLHEAYDDGTFQIVGIVLDAGDPVNDVMYDDLVDEAVQIAEAAGAVYTNIVPTSGFAPGLLTGIQYVPTTFFVNSEGSVIGGAYVGSRSYEEWESIVDEILAFLE